jgi:RNA recognition motif-containing protein
MNIYIGNLDYDLQENELEQAFSEYGTVESVKIIKDKFTGRGRGFGFIEMPNEEEAEKAIEGLNGTELKGRTMKVNKAKPRSENA